MLFALGILAFYHPVNLMQKSAGALLDDGTGMETPTAVSSTKLNTCLLGVEERTCMAGISELGLANSQK